MNITKLLKFIVPAFLLVTAFSSCSKEISDKRDSGYGYAQFKIYKEASYEGSKASLDYLRDASKVMVQLQYGEVSISQTLTLSYADAESAEYGVRSARIKLLTGNYKVVTYTIFDNLDNEVYKSGNGGEFDIVEGGLTVHDLTADVTPRGKAMFTFTKFFASGAKSSAESSYTFDEIRKAELVLSNTVTGVRTQVRDLETSFDIHFDESDDKEDDYMTSSQACTTKVSLRAGKYKLVSYTLYDKDGDLLETGSPHASAVEQGLDIFEVKDNSTTEVNVPVTMHEAAAYLKDYYALREIWESLDGPNWYYKGEDWAEGANWDFEHKSPDLWGDQPGVQLHPNGRVALINIGDFCFKGELSPAIGKLTELTELYLGSHNDINMFGYDPTLKRDGGDVERFNRHKEYMDMMHPASQLSEPIARALKEHDIRIPEIALYDNYSEEQIMAMSRPEGIQLKDVRPGTLCNGLTKLPKEMGNLHKLERFYVANGLLEDLPMEMGELESLEEIEIYNCPKMTKAPEVFSKFKALEVVNLGYNPQLGEGEAEKIVDMLSKSPSAAKIQILYMNNCNMTVLDGAAIKRMPKIGLLDLASNKIERITEAFGSEIGPTKFFINNNRLTEFPVDENGVFCNMDDVENFTASNNLLTEFPDIFDAKSVYTMGSVDFSFNHISRVQNAGNGYKGLKVTTLTLNNNEELTMFPAAFAESNSIITNFALRGCSLEGFEKKCFVGKTVVDISSLDLSYNHLKKLSDEMIATNMPYLYGIDISYNRFTNFPFTPLDCAYLTVFAIRGQRNENGARCLAEWPTGIYKHKGLRGLYLGSNNLGKVDDTISTLCYYLDISDNPEIIFDASDICYEYARGRFYLIYDTTQDIRNCEYIVKE